MPARHPENVRGIDYHRTGNQKNPLNLDDHDYEVKETHNRIPPETIP